MSSPWDRSQDRGRDQDLGSRVAVERLPACFARFEHEPEQMPAGAPGKVGLVQLRFEARGGRRTQLVSSYASGPQRVGRALFLDPALADMAFTFIQSVGGGILQGDRLAIEVTVASGAQAHVTTQSATKLYRMEHNYATQRLALRAEPGAYLEYLPDYLIAYRSARLYQEIELEVADDATVVFADALAPGRVALGEAFAYDLLFTRVRAHDPHGRLRFTDTMVLEPGRREPRRIGLLRGGGGLGSLYVLTRRMAAHELATCLSDCVEATPAVDGGASRLPGDNGAVVRVIGENVRAVQRALHRSWQTTRELLCGVKAPSVQRFKYGQEPGAGVVGGETGNSGSGVGGGGSPRRTPKERE